MKNQVISSWNRGLGALVGTLAIGFVLIQGQVASARSIDRTPVVAQVSGFKYGIKEINLLADGRLQVVKNQEGPEGVQQVVETVLLQSDVSDRLSGLARTIANAPVKEEHRQVVCMMVPGPVLKTLKVSGYDPQKMEFDSKLRVLLTDSDCYMSDVVYPESDRHAKAAERLNEAMIVLALSTLN